MDVAHLHLVLNHLPIVGGALAIPLLALALWRRPEPGILLATALVVGLAGLGAPLAYLTGEGAEEIVEELPGASHDAIEQHEERALLAAVLSSIVGLLGVGAAVIERRRGRPLAGRWIAALLVLALASAGAMAATGASGGRIRRPELRGEAAPASAGDHQGQGRGRGRGRGGEESEERDHDDD